jgi:hypothetical protein
MDSPSAEAKRLEEAARQAQTGNSKKPAVARAAKPTTGRANAARQASALTAEDIASIRAKRAAGASIWDIAIEHGGLLQDVVRRLCK